MTDYRKWLVDKDFEGGGLDLLQTLVRGLGVPRRHTFNYKPAIVSEIRSGYFPTGDRGGTVVKVLCYKSEGRWLDPSLCHWNFLLT